MNIYKISETLSNLLIHPIPQLLPLHFPQDRLGLLRVVERRPREDLPKARRLALRLPRRCSLLAQLVAQLLQQLADLGVRRIQLQRLLQVLLVGEFVGESRLIGREFLLQKRDLTRKKEIITFWQHWSLTRKVGIRGFWIQKPNVQESDVDLQAEFLCIV